MEWAFYVTDGMEILFLGIGAILDKRNQRLPVSFLVFFSVIIALGNRLCANQMEKKICLSLFPGIACLLLGRLTGEKIGYGDGWGILILGFSGKFQRLLRILMIAFALGGVYGLWNRIIRKKSLEQTIPFYPCLFAARIGVML